MKPFSISGKNVTARAPSPTDLLAAKSFVGAHYPRTPLYFSSILSRDIGSEIFVKYENHGPVRSFKARGALYRLSLLDKSDRRRGVVTASTGNHGQGMAYAGGVLGVPTITVVPEGSPRLKTENIRALGGELRVFGNSLHDAEVEARAIAKREGKVFIEDGNDAGLMAGAGTVAWDILDQLPKASALLVPVGGGNLIAGVALVAKRLRPDVRVVGVQSAAAPSVYLSWKEKKIRKAQCKTFAGGLATSRPGALAFAVLRDLVDLMVLVSESEIREAVLTVLNAIGQVAEGAGAAPFAALKKVSSVLKTGPTVLILSGGNLPVEDLRSIMSS